MNTRKKIIYVDMDDVICDYATRYRQKILAVPDIKYPQSQCDFFRKLEPISGAIEGVNWLSRQEHFNVYILTAPSTRNPFSYIEKRLWIEDYFGLEWVEKLIITPNKGLNKGDYLIDDRIDGKGQEQFEGKILHFGSNEFPNWSDIINYFKKKYK